MRLRGSAIHPHAPSRCERAASQISNLGNVKSFERGGLPTSDLKTQ